jgi:hypothetical protein
LNGANFNISSLTPPELNCSRDDTFWIPDDREAGQFLDDLSRNELHWLEVALRSARFQTGAFERGGDILSGSTMPFAAGFTPGENLFSSAIKAFIVSHVWTALALIDGAVIRYYWIGPWYRRCALLTQRQHLLKSLTDFYEASVNVTVFVALRRRALMKN